MEGWHIRLSGLLGKYKYAMAVALLGIGLMLLPTGKTAVEPEPEAQTQSQDQQELEQRLSRILSQIQGAGQVQVLLTEKTGEELLYQTDTQQQTAQAEQSNQSETVILSDGQRAQAGLLRRRDPPQYLGAVVVCQGGDSAQVRLAIVQAVGCVTGLDANQISVLKMK